MSTRELPQFLKHGFPDIGLPPAKCRPGTMRFPEAPPPRDPWGHDGAGGNEQAARAWVSLVDAGLIGG